MRLAIVGASARAAACSALQAGHEVVAADLFADVDLVARCPATRIDCWPEQFEPWLADQLPLDGWFYTGGLENYTQLVNRMARIAPLLGSGGEVLGLVRSPEAMGHLLTAAGCRVPETIIAEPPVGEAAWLRKHRLSCGGMGISRYESLSTPQCETQPEEVYHQRFVAGESISAAYVAAQSQCVMLGATEQIIGRDWTRAGEFQYSGSVGPLDRGDARDVALVAAGEAVARESHIVGLFGIDFIIDTAGQLWFLEVNPRYTASMELIEQISELSMIETHLTACRDGILPHPQAAMRRNWNSTRFFGKAYVFAQRDVAVGDLRDNDLCDVPPRGQVIAAGNPVATVMATASHRSDVEPKLRSRAATLEKTLYEK